jgi:O-antigen/teichoic acid export membrane protein
VIKSNAIWAIADQGIVSVGNFGTSVLLARFFSPAQFGLFVLIYTLTLALNTAQLSLVNYPLSIMAARVESGDVSKVAIAGFTLTLLCLLPFCLLIAAVVLLLGAPEICFPAAGALICWQMQETARRVLLSRFEFKLALASDLISYLGQLLCLWLLARFHELSLSSVFFTIGITCLASLVLQSTAVRIRISFRDLLRYRAMFWSIGKIAFGSNFLNALTLLVFPWLLAIQGKSLSAEFYALTTVLGVTNPIAFGLGNLLLPQTARHAELRDRSAAIESGARAVYAGAFLLLPYFCVLWAWPSRCLAFFYGSSSPYVPAIWSLRWLIVGFFGAYLAHVLGTILFGLEDGHIVLLAQAAGTIVALTAAPPFSYWRGVAGASMAFALMQVTRTAVTGVLMRSRMPASVSG